MPDGHAEGGETFAAQGEGVLIVAVLLLLLFLRILLSGR